MLRRSDQPSGEACSVVRVRWTAWTVAILGLLMAACGTDDEKPVKRATSIVVADEDAPYHFAAPGRIAACRYELAGRSGTVRCDPSQAPPLVPRCTIAHAISFTVGSRGAGQFTCVVPDALPRARDLRVLAAGSSLKAGPITCVARPEPALSCENEHGGGFVLRPDDSAVFRLR